MSQTAVQTDWKHALGFGLGERLRWAIVIAHTESGWEVVRSADENGEEFDLLRIALETSLALKGLLDRELQRLAEDGEAKEETP